MRAEDMFKHYKDLRQELAMITFEISHFTGISQEDVIEVMTFQHDDEVKVQNSDISKRTEDIALILNELYQNKNNEWYKYLADRWNYLDDEISFFEFCIEQLGGRKADIVFELIDGDLTWDNIADQYHVSRSMIAVYRNQAIKEINRLYDMREQERKRFAESLEN